MAKFYGAVSYLKKNIYIYIYIHHGENIFTDFFIRKLSPLPPLKKKKFFFSIKNNKNC